MTRKEIGSALRERRMSFKISQDKMASITQLTRQQIIKIENGQADYRLETLNKYLVALGGNFKVEFEEEFELEF